MAVRRFCPSPFFPNLCQSAKSVDHWFWLRPKAALRPPCSGGEQSCGNASLPGVIPATEPISAGRDKPHLVGGDGRGTGERNAQTEPNLGRVARKRRRRPPEPAGTRRRQTKPIFLRAKRGASGLQERNYGE
jgi:hypothetical protein